MQPQELMQQADQVIMGTYKRFPIVLVKGLGTRVWDSTGKEYLDLVAGIAVCNLGHSHRRVIEAISKQVENITHVSNLYYLEPQVRLAKLLVENSFADRVFFCNSGAEANEAAIKLARKYSRDNSASHKYELICMRNSFHGRTLATVAATGQEKFHRGFEPLPEGFRFVPYDDLASLEEAISDKTCGVLLEPIQGEGGVNIPSENYLRGVRNICDRHKLLMILDEVQTGMGRTGTFFAYEQAGMKPDILTLAKALGNGFPVGAMLATEKVASAFVPGSHASTFGGNFLAMAASCAAVETLLHEGILENCRVMGTYFLDQLAGLMKKHAAIKAIRGRGLMVAMELAGPGDEIVRLCLERGLLINCTNGNIIRFVPPLIISSQDIDRAVEILDEVMRGL
jgi:acetylornithine/N-succinyldiaminopimelate aminotransferase